MKNQDDLDQYLDQMIEEAERKIDQLFANRLKEIKSQIAAMYEKYSRNGELSYTELNKYNRFRKEMEVMVTEIHQDYRELFKLIKDLMEKQFVENYLRSAYLYEFEAQVKMGFTIPTAVVIMAALENPIEKLKLPNVLEAARNEIVNDISIEIAQGLLIGEGYAKMAKRIENRVHFSRAKARRVSRTEAHRVQVEGRLRSAEKASKKADLKKMWVSTLDTKTRIGHKKLDGKVVDRDGVFKSIYGGVGKAPGHMHNAKDDINCRCSIIFLVNGKVPEVRRARVEGENVVIPYQTYEEWEKQLKKVGKHG
ncbi:phage minor head protein [Bacillus sp. CLL-7-23]|uniref:Phage minor head protein n=1 Tax=Bacillus changyiensis TaxID=3004103 RepID=A0ABT4X8A8_9BACI|nr:phage minor head protein [Bacillus changyiensis]MDA7028463.1 phage minor head protein [Bacillus changyiensis]